MKPTVKEPFVIVDTDTESAGSTFLYRAKDKFYKDSRYPSVQRRMVIKDDTNYAEADDSDKEKFFKTMCPVGAYFGLPEAEQNAVLLIGANLDRNSAKDADVAGDGGDDGEQMENFSNNITKACKACGAKALFFDTPSGTQFLARKSIKESEIIVCCMRPTFQFREGTHGQLLNFVKLDIKNRNRKRVYVLTPTTVCVDKGQQFGPKKDAYPEKALTEIKALFNSDNLEDEDQEVKDAFKSQVMLDMLEPTKQDSCDASVTDIFGIPEIKRFKWFEECLGRLLIDGKELSNNDKMGLGQYDKLAQTILKYRKQ